MVRSDLWNYGDACIVVKEKITVEIENNANERNEKRTFKNNSPFKLCISKTNNTFVDNTEDLDIVILMYNFLDCSDNYSITSGNLWN